MATQTKSQRKILNISLPNQFYLDVEKIAKKRAQTKAEFVRESLRKSIQDEKEWAEIRKLGTATAKKYGIKNEDDVERIVDEVRSG